MSSVESRSLLYYINILSLDVAAGAVICCAFFGEILGAPLLLQGYITLGLTVWIIYTCDHLLDVRRSSGTAATERHRFHQKNFYILLSMVIISIIIAGIQVIFIRRPVFMGGLMLSFIVLLYFAFLKRLKFLKEFFAALLYTSGVLIAPLSLVERSLSFTEYGLIIQFFLTALINLFIFSWFGMSSDQADKHPSFALTFGERTTRVFLASLFIMQTGLTMGQIVASQLIGPAMLIYFMNLILLAIFIKPDYFKDDRYRLVGDAVFLIPAVYLVIWKFVD